MDAQIGEADERVPLLEASLTERAKQIKEGASKRSTLLTVCPYILGNELCERLAYYGLATNLVTYIVQEFGGNPGFACILVSVFEGLCYTTPVIGALLADSVWGRYKTILVFSNIYLLGVILLTGTSLWPVPPTEMATPLQYGMLCGSLGIIALGTGGIKPNVAAFGADQFDPRNPRDLKEKESFFNWFYLAINVGSLIAVTVIVYIQDSISWTIGFAVPGLAMFLAIICFVSGSKQYSHVLPTESPMARVVKVVHAAVHNRRRKKKHGIPDVPKAPEHQRDSSLRGGQTYLMCYAADRPAVAGMDSPTAAAAVVAAAADGPPLARNYYTGPTQGQLPKNLSYRWLEDAVTEWQSSQGDAAAAPGGQAGLAGYTAQQVEEVKLVLRMLPIFATTVLYWTIYTQMGSMFVLQGSVMQRSLDWHGDPFEVPSASMAIFNTIAIIMLIWLYDKYFEPALRRTRYRMTLLRRIGWGMLVAALAMLNAAGVEWWRLQVYHQQQQEHGCDPANCLPGAVARACLCEGGAADVSIFWQAPQYVLVGLSEVLTSIGQMEFFYDQAPDVMRSCSMALSLLSTALGSYLSGALTWLVQVCSQQLTGQQWLPDDLNQGRLDLFFVLMAVLMVLNFAAFLVVAVRYEYKEVQHVHLAASFTFPTPPAAQQAQASARLLPAAAPSATSAPMPVPRPGAAAAITILNRQQQRGRPGRPSEAPDLEEGAPERIYSRSLAYVPPSPNLPGPFR